MHVCSGSDHASTITVNCEGLGGMRNCHLGSKVFTYCCRGKKTCVRGEHQRP